MLDKTTDEEVVLRPVDKEAPAIFVRINSQVGPNRQIEMSFGIPLDMTPKDLNDYIDKVTACADRQNEKGILAQLRFDLLEAQRRLQDDLQHLANFETKHEGDWYNSGRKGPWEPNGQQRAELKTLQTNIRNWRDTVIPTKEKQIAEYEAKIKGE